MPPVCRRDELIPSSRPRVSQVRSNSPCCLLGLLLGYEDGCTTFRRNMCKLL
jgi:hypothetical protein